MPSETMNKDQIEKFHKRLTDMLDSLENGAVGTVSGMRDDATAFPDPTDRASLESDRNLTLRIRDRERKLRSKIEEALERIEGGTFGICEVCEGPIGEKRLEARPVTTLCISCKSSQEDEEERLHIG